MTSLVLHTHTGLGDHFITNGMAHAFAEQFDTVYVPHISMFSETMKCLYNDTPKVVPVEFPDIDITLYGQQLLIDLAENTNSELYHISDPYINYFKRLYINTNSELRVLNVASNFERQMYELAGMHYSYRYNKSNIPRSTKKSKEIYLELTKGDKYILVHDVSSQTTSPYNLLIDQTRSNLPIIKIVPGITNNVLDFLELIYNAEEIHVVGSFFFCLVDCITDRTSASLFYHNIMIKHDSQINCNWNNNRWTIIDYDKKI